MKILVDAMGGDNAPGEIVKGAVRAQRELGVEIVLVGKKEEVEACLRAENASGIEVIDAREVVTMEDDPSTATRRKKDSSMTVGLNRLRDGEADAMVSAGSTGALLTGATLIVKLLGFLFAAAGFLFGVYLVFRKLFSPDIEMGYSSIMVSIVVIGGLLMLMLGIIGEYLGRIYICLNKSPQYVVRTHIGFDSDSVTCAPSFLSRRIAAIPLLASPMTSTFFIAGTPWSALSHSV